MARRKQQPDAPRDIAFMAPVDIQAAADQGGCPKFAINAYNGGTMRLPGLFSQVVVDLSGLKVASQSVPILKDHNPGKIVGHSSVVANSGSALNVSGLVSGTGEAAQEVVANSRNGFPWQASIGARVEKMEFVGDGVVCKVNGQEFTGPLNVARRTTLGEVSFVALGADTSTSARIAAQAAQETDNMDYEKWLEGRGFAQADLDDKQQASMKALFDADQKAAPPATVKAAGTAVADPPVVVDLTQVRAEAAKEARRIAAINTACGAKHADIAAKAIEELWDGDRTELEILRAERPKAPAVIIPNANVDRSVLLATGLLNGRVSEKSIVATCGEKAIEAASRFRGCGIRDYFRLVARSEGRELPMFSGTGTEFIEAAFSTISLPGILSNVANKIMLEAYNNVEQSYRAVVRVGSLNDFKPHYRYRMTEDMKFQKVGPDGQLQHGKLGEQKYTIQADTMGILFSLARQMIVNDDMSAFADIPRRIGIGSAEAIVEAVWTLLLANKDSAGNDFFATANKNILTGTDYVLSVDGLSAGYTQFLQQTKPNGRPLGLEPRVLLVPTTLRVLAETLMASKLIIESIATTGSTSKPKPQDNPMAGKFTVASSAYLCNATLAGYSNTAYYLFADPQVMHAIEIGFLNGMEMPTVERAEADFQTLGIQFRGFVDFGVAMGEPRAALKVTGAA
jgi:Spy/CpxP family protein refolding chaperone